MKDSFCILPFIHFNAYPDNKIKTCCYSQSFFKTVDLSEQSIVKAFNSQEYKKVRKDLLNGVKHSYCDVCWRAEESGAQSQRLKWNEYYKEIVDYVIDKTEEDGYIKPEFVSLDLRPSNVCNFKCRTCTPDFSTNWIDERNKFHKEMKIDNHFYDTKKSSFEIPKEHLSSLERIYFAGGEPLFMSEMYEFLDKIRDKKNVSLYFNTNFSILKHKGENVFDLFNEFKNVHFAISCDGVEEIGEYVRTNFNWVSFCENVIKLGEFINTKNKNFRYGFQYTCSILNCFHFFEFRKKLYENKFISTDEQLQFGFAEYPFWLNPANFDLKWGVIDYFKDNLKSLETVDDSAHGLTPLKTEIENYIHYLMGVEDQHPNALFYLKNFVKFSNEYNNTQLPQKLNYLEKYLKDEPKHTL